MTTVHMDPVFGGPGLGDHAVFSSGSLGSRTLASCQEKAGALAWTLSQGVHSAPLF